MSARDELEYEVRYALKTGAHTLSVEAVTLRDVLSDLASAEAECRGSGEAVREQMKTCETCRHWVDFEENADVSPGECRMILNMEIEGNRDAPFIYTEDAKAHLITYSDFGCVLHESEAS